MGSSSNPRKHHFLPQFYLRGFSVDGRGIFQIRKTDAIVNGCNIKDVAAIRDYHEIDGGDVEDPNSLEKALSQVEGIQAAQLKDALSEGIKSIDNRLNLIEFLAVMRMRVPAVKEHIERSYSSTVKATAYALDRAGKLPKRPAGLEEKLSIENIHIEIANWKCLEKMFRMGSSPKSLSALSRMRANLLHAPFGSRFITSDQPVSIFHPTLHNSPYGAGPSTAGAEVAFALSSRSLLLLDHASAPHSERIASVAEVNELNRRTIVMARDYIYTGESPALAAAAVQAAGKVFAGFRHEDLRTEREFLQIHRFIPVGPPS